MTGINSRTIQKLWKRMRERGSIENLPRSEGRRKTTPRDDRILFRSVKTNRRQTLKDVTARFNQRTSCNVSSITVCRRLFREGYTRCKLNTSLYILFYLWHSTFRPIPSPAMLNYLHRIIQDNFRT
jgi:transposase